jgi:hypothetical protein
MGDNVNFNVALARILGLPQARCLAHSLSLTAKHAVGKLPDLKIGVTVAGGIMKAGGSSKRMGQWRTLGLNPNRGITYANRFASAVSNAIYRLDNFDAIKTWSLQLAAEEADDDAEDDDDDDVVEGAAALEDRVDQGQPATSKRIESIKNFYWRQEAKAVLACCKGLLGAVPDLVEVVSGENDSVPADLLERLNAYGCHLQEASTASGARIVSGACVLQDLQNVKLISWRANVRVLACRGCPGANGNSVSRSLACRKHKGSNGT